MDTSERDSPEKHAHTQELRPCREADKTLQPAHALPCFVSAGGSGHLHRLLRSVGMPVTFPCVYPSICSYCPRPETLSRGLTPLPPGGEGRIPILGLWDDQTQDADTGQIRWTALYESHVLTAQGRGPLPHEGPQGATLRYRLNQQGPWEAGFWRPEGRVVLASYGSM